MYFHYTFSSFLSSPLSTASCSVVEIQDAVYNYFSKYFGTMSDLTKQSLESKYDKLSVRALKKGLHSLKPSATLYCSSEIKYVSAIIRNKLRTRMTNKDNDGSSLLRKNIRSKFWTTCHKLFAVGL